VGNSVSSQCCYMPYPKELQQFIYIFVLSSHLTQLSPRIPCY
jgi:hypothetical protein